MNLNETILYNLSEILLCLVLMFWGIFALFKSEKLVSFYLAIMTKLNPTNFLLKRTKKNIEKEKFYFNLKLCGMVAILLSLIFLISDIYRIIKV